MNEVLKLYRVFSFCICFLLAASTAFGQMATMAFWKTSGGSYKLAFTTSAYTGQTTWTCNFVFIQVQTTAGAAHTVTSPTTINLSGPSGIHFYSSSTCSPATEVTTATVSAGQSQVAVYFTSGKQGSPQLTAASTGMTSGSQTQTFTAYEGCTWLGTTTTWATASNWSCGHVPTSTAGDIAVFDSNCTNCTPASPTSNQTPYGLNVTEDFGGVLNLGSSGTMSVSTGGCFINGGTVNQGSKAFSCSTGFVQGGGTFNGGTAAVTLNRGITLYGGSFLMGSSIANTLTAGGPLTGSINLNGGSFILGAGAASFTFGTASHNISAGTFTVGSGGVTFAGVVTVTGTGIYNGGSAANTFSSSLTIAAGTFVFSTGTTTVGKNYSTYSSATITSPTSSTLSLTCSSTCTVLVASENYANVTFAGTAGTFNVSGTMNVTGTFLCGDINYYGYNMNGGTINVTGTTLSANNYGYTGTTVVKVAGNASGQTLSTTGSGGFPTLNIAAGTNPVTFGSTVVVYEDYTLTSVGTLTVTGSTLALGCQGVTCTITPGTVAYNNVSFVGNDATFQLGGSTMTVNGNLLLEDLAGGGLTMNSGTVKVYGTSIQAAIGGTNSAGGYEGTAVIVAAGNAAGQTISGVAGAAFPTLQISAGTNPVTLSGEINVTENYSYISSGTFTTTGSTLDIAPIAISATIIPGTVTYNNVSFIGANANISLSGGTFHANGNVIIGSTNGGGYIFSNGTVSVGGNLTYNNNGYTGTVAVTLTGASPTITVSGTPGIPTGNMTVSISGTATLAGSLSLNMPGQSLSVTSGAINMSNNNLTVANTLTLASGTSITRGTGTLKVGGTTLGAGPYSSGTIN